MLTPQRASGCASAVCECALSTGRVDTMIQDSWQLTASCLTSRNTQKQRHLTISALNCRRQHIHSLAPVPVLAGILPSSFLVVQHHWRQQHQLVSQLTCPVCPLLQCLWMQPYELHPHLGLLAVPSPGARCCILVRHS